MNKFLPFLLACLLLLKNDCSTAAIPIQKAKTENAVEQSKPESTFVRSNTTLEKANTQNQHLAQPNDNSHEKDFGLFGILSLVTGLLGIFPAAIILGIIGQQKGRKLKGLALAGLILGCISLLLFLLVLLVFVALLSA